MYFPDGIEGAWNGSFASEKDSIDVSDDDGAEGDRGCFELALDLSDKFLHN